ncbi:MAG: tetratricopeptide repeat protein [Rhodospirillales bacterium]|nr:tetratricopeptide repeat protein [Rhodospirillales bacterium]
MSPPELSSALIAAVQALQSGNFAHTEALCRAALVGDPRQPATLHMLALALTQLGRRDEALEYFCAAADLAPQDSQIHFNHGLVLQSAGETAAAVAAFRRAIRINPRHAGANEGLAIILQQQGRGGEAIEALQAVIAAHPGRASAHANLAWALAKTGKLRQAADSFCRAIAAEPAVAEFRAGLAIILFDLGDHAGALAACDACLVRQPGHARAIAIKALVLDERGERETARQLIDFDRLLWRKHWEPPPDGVNLSTFNAAVVNHVLAHPTLRRDRSDKTTRHGSQTDELLAEPKGPLVTLESMIYTAIDAYCRAMPTDPSHPFLAARPLRWTLRTWATVLGHQGHQNPHHHPGGWLSGVYYVKLPTVVTTPGDPAGWIEFGRPDPRFRYSFEPEIRLIQPEEGLMLLFPSYFWHRTIPFESDEVRISVAFDVIPAA